MADGFFPKSVRRQVRLINVQPLVGANDERRIKIQLSMPISGEAVVGLPDWVADSAEYVATVLDSATVEKTFEGMNMDVYATEKGEHREHQLTSCKLTKFRVGRCGDAENPDVLLYFTLYAPFNSKVWNWAGPMAHNDFYAKFDQMQLQLEKAS